MQILLGLGFGLGYFVVAGNHASVNKQTEPMKKPVKYYAYKGNEEMALRNGSFLRTSGLKPTEFVQYMNGDFMGFVPAVDMNAFSEVETDKALKLIPRCCGGKR